MEQITALIYLIGGGTRTEIFFNPIEMDDYYEGNKHLIEKIVPQ